MAVMHGAGLRNLQELQERVQAIADDMLGGRPVLAGPVRGALLGEPGYWLQTY